MSITRTRLVLALLIVLAPTVVRAQESNRGKNVNVRFIVAEKFSGHGVSAVVQQTGGPKSEYIIAVRREFLSPETLAQCLNSLTQIVDRSGGNRSVRVQLRILERTQLRQAANDDEAQRLLKRLRHSQRKKVDKIQGDVQSFEATIKLR